MSMGLTIAEIGEEVQASVVLAGKLAPLMMRVDELASDIEKKCAEQKRLEKKIKHLKGVVDTLEQIESGTGRFSLEFAIGDVELDGICLGSEANEELTAVLTKYTTKLLSE